MVLLQEVDAETGTSYFSVLFPGEEARTLDHRIPREISGLFEEAAVAESAGAMRAAGVMYRATAEAVAVQQGATERTLYDKISSLSTLPADVVSSLHQARTLGNYSIHDALEFSVDEIEDVAELLVEVLEILYVEPAKRNEMAAKRKARTDAADAAKAASGKP